MPSSSRKNIRQHVIERVLYFSGAKHDDVSECYLDRDLRMDGDDFVDLCEDLERSFQIDLRSFFEDGVTQRRWWLFCTYPVTRDVKVMELADHVEMLTTSRL